MGRSRPGISAQSAQNGLGVPQPTPQDFEGLDSSPTDLFGRVILTIMWICSIAMLGGIVWAVILWRQH